MMLGQRSELRLAGVHLDLARVVRRAFEISAVPFKVIEGVRTIERQQELYAQGRSAPGKIVTWTMKSKHLKQADGHGHAVDLLPAPYDWNDPTPFDQVAQAMFAAADELGIRSPSGKLGRDAIRWGADWDQDGKPRERGESDSPHFELAP